MTLQRGDNAVLSLDMEALHRAYMRAIVAAAGCQFVEISPDTNKLDMAIMHTSAAHLGDSTAEVRLQLKSTYALKHDVISNAGSGEFSYTLDNATLARLSEENVTIPRALVLMVLPSEPDLWTTATDTHLSLAHHCYFVNLRGHPITGKADTNVRVSLANRLDAHSLSDMMQRVGQREAI